MALPLHHSRDYMRIIAQGAYAMQPKAFEVGKKYQARCGHIMLVTRQDNTLAKHPFLVGHILKRADDLEPSQIRLSWMMDGCYLPDGREHGFDLLGPCLP